MTPRRRDRSASVSADRRAFVADQPCTTDLDAGEALRRQRVGVSANAAVVTSEAGIHVLQRHVVFVLLREIDDDRRGVRRLKMKFRAGRRKGGMANGLRQVAGIKGAEPPKTSVDSETGRRQDHRLSIPDDRDTDVLS